ncbi:ABC transporter ATP-binding protein [Spirilliplanes yamanashiensis]|uniref:ABC transporter ATP-binding protein n=1 Tax=Spirilliplanes yamanashiensis TaxID=42233 RepID=UPI00194FD569|nr:ATP-binding cassette domain-containing protein [Spirilliplanes yamanashiensis]MDP9818224.1 ABC-2 type transport system ATP-binding protein [Spirilliplanes yamanashiensis]
MGTLLEFAGVSKSYGSVRALDGCTFTAAPKRLVGLLGPNGAGKTTLMRCLLGLVEPDAGTLRWRGSPVTDEVRRRFGYMPEERGLYPSMPVDEQVRYFARLSGLSRSAAARSARAVTDRVGLGPELAGRRVEQLSHGNQQRVQLAVALVHEPEVVVLDEPFAGLDPLGVQTLGGVLRDLADEGTTLLFSSHQLDLVQHLCQDVVTMDRGRVVLAGPLEELQQATRRRHIDVTFGRRPAPGWSTALPGVAGGPAAERRVRLTLAADGDPATVLRAALAAGPVLRFALEPPSLEEMFREAVHR